VRKVTGTWPANYPVIRAATTGGLPPIGRP